MTDLKRRPRAATELTRRLASRNDVTNVRTLLMALDETNKTNEHSKRSGEKTVTARQT